MLRRTISYSAKVIAMLDIQPENVDPTLIKRQCGGFLAISPESLSLKIGVEANTENEAVSRYRQRLSKHLSYAKEREQSKHRTGKDLPLKHSDYV